VNVTVQQEPKKSLTKKVIGFFKVLGPGVITGAADDDPSGIATYSQTGAQFGFGQLWTALYQIPLLLSVQEACGRIGAVTGTGLAGVIKTHYTRKILIGVVVLVAIANTINIGADIGAVAASAQLVVNLPYWLLAVATTVLLVVSEVLITDYLQNLCACAQVVGIGTLFLSSYGADREAAVERDSVRDGCAAYRTDFFLFLHHYGGLWNFDLTLHVLLAGFGGSGRRTSVRHASRPRWPTSFAAELHPRNEDRHAGWHGLGRNCAVVHYHHDSHCVVQTWYNDDQYRGGCGQGFGASGAVVS